MFSRDPGRKASLPSVAFDLHHHVTCDLAKVQAARILGGEDEPVIRAATLAALNGTRDETPELAAVSIAGVPVPTEQPALAVGPVAMSCIAQEAFDPARLLEVMVVVALLDVAKESADRPADAAHCIHRRVADG